MVYRRRAQLLSNKDGGSPMKCDSDPSSSVSADLGV